MNISTMARYINARHNDFIQHATKTRKNNANYDEYAKIICKIKQKQANCMRNTIIIRKRYKFYNNTQNTNFITMQKKQIL